MSPAFIKENAVVVLGKYTASGRALINVDEVKNTSPNRAPATFSLRCTRTPPNKIEHILFMTRAGFYV